LTTADEAQGRIRYLMGCCLNDETMPFAVEDVESCPVFVSGCYCRKHTRGGGFCGDYCDSWEFMVVGLKDGRVGVVKAWADTTGHG
jgi:hypothetical protein